MQSLTWKILSFLAAMSLPVGALATICTADLNGSGAIDTAAEMATCQATPQGDYCSVGSQACTVAETCPIDPNLSCIGGQCTQPGLCKPRITPGGALSGYTCSLDNATYVTRAACLSSCTKTAQCIAQPPKCPLGNQYACMEVTAGNFRCSPNNCIDPNTINETNININQSMPDNSGPRDASGACLGQIKFFAGRGMSCKKAGVKSNFTNCCNIAKNDTVSDSLGSDIQSLVKQQALVAMYDFATAAYSAYATGLSAQTAANYAWNTIANPGYLAGAAVTIIVIYLMTPQCSKTDMETSTLKKSGLCHYVGTFCSTRWPLVGCVQRKNTYCCFNSELARIINEQGRLQMPTTNGWGTAKNPNCSGFTPEQFQSLDFSKMDLSEYYGYIQQDANSMINNNVPQQQTKDAVQRFYNGLQ